MSKLLILGNGFDLHCGLDSSYSHFFNYLLQDKEFNIVYNYMHDRRTEKSEKRTNFLWALLLSYHQDKNIVLWKDIESIIASFLYKPTSEYTINILDILGNIQKYTDDLRNYDKTMIDQGLPLTKFLWLIYRGIGLDEICEFKRTSQREVFIAIPRNKDKVIDLFYKDLNEIECKFVDYLNSIYNINPLIHVSANNAYEKLLNVVYPNDTSPEDKVSIISSAINDANILSFNYTRLGQPNGSNFSRYKNIHGTIIGKHQDIIFGIDSFDISPLDPTFKFTKTYRIALQESKLLINPDIFEGRISLNNISEIIIYGHSLNRQDYSYFYAIFNKCNINNSNVKLDLYYSNYDDINRAPESILRLQNLFQQYEIDFQIPKGLFHRMLLEDRVHFIKL